MNKAAIQERNNYIVDLAFKGYDQIKIAKEVGLQQSQVSKILRQDDTLKSVIKNATQYNIERLPDTVIEHDKLCLSEDEKIRLQAIKLRYDITGISPSHTQNVYINNLYQDNRQQLISSDVIELLNKHTVTITNDMPLKIEHKQQDVVDVTPDNE